FKAKGFTMVGGQSLIEGEMLSLPATLNASMVTKFRYHKTNGDTNNNASNKGAFEIPDEAALLLGGRVGEHVGFIFEMQMAEDGAPAFAAYKMPIGFDAGGAHIEIIPFATDAFGPQFSFELLNTGAQRSIRVLENRSAISAVQKLGLQGAAQGVGFAAYHTTGYINYTAWQPETGKAASSSGDFFHYLRIAATPQIVDGWDIGGGVQLWSGTGKLDDGITYNKKDAYALALQAQGNVGNMPLGLYATYGNAKKSAAGKTANTFNTGTNDDATAWSVLGELGVITNKATVALGYMGYDDGTATDNEQTITTVGATYLIAQNVELQANHSWKGGSYYDLATNNAQANGDQETLLMLFSAF
ncbi:MAG: hypothetical protein IME99_06045, partial [Proteobacteria bacterium]|nr:hypothetical protein [Pseudomonadota bacterium]